MVRGQGVAVDLPDHPRLPAGHVDERQVGGVAGLTRSKDVRRARAGRAASSSVSTDTPVNVIPSFDQLVTQWMSPT